MTLLRNELFSIYLDVIASYTRLVSQDVLESFSKRVFFYSKLSIVKTSSFGCWQEGLKMVSFSTTLILHDPPGGTPHMKGVGMLVGNFELNP